MIQVQRGAWSGTTFTEDVSQRTTFTYSGTNGGYSANTNGRVSLATYTGPHGLAVSEMYSYLAAGDVKKKKLVLSGTPFGSATPALEASYSFDNEGHVSAVQYPVAQWNTNNTTTAGPAYTYGYDALGRLNTMTDQANNSLVSSVSYTPANQVSQLTASTFTETRSYNANFELTELVSGANVHLKYTYSATQNNGQIASQTDVLSGETISYQYDTLLRLTQASATGDSHGALINDNKNTWPCCLSQESYRVIDVARCDNHPARHSVFSFLVGRVAVVSVRMWKSWFADFQGTREGWETRCLGFSRLSSFRHLHTGLLGATLTPERMRAAPKGRIRAAVFPRCS